MVNIRSTAAQVRMCSTGETSKRETPKAISGLAGQAQAFVPNNAVRVASSSPGTGRQVNMAIEGGMNLDAELALCIANMEQSRQQERPST